MRNRWVTHLVTDRLRRVKRQIKATGGTPPQGFAADGVGIDVKLHGSNLEPPMSALCQKQTFSGRAPMSALPPKADIGTQPRNVRYVPKADSCGATISIATR